MFNTNEILKGIEGLQNETIKKINDNLTPEMFEGLGREQQEMIREAKKGLNFKNVKPSEKLSEITQILRKNGL